MRTASLTCLYRPRDTHPPCLERPCLLAAAHSSSRPPFLYLGCSALFYFCHNIHATAVLNNKGLRRLQFSCSTCNTACCRRHQATTHTFKTKHNTPLPHRPHASVNMTPEVGCFRLWIPALSPFARIQAQTPTVKERGRQGYVSEL